MKIKLKSEWSGTCVERPYIQYWDRPEPKADTVFYHTYWNPSRGNVRIGKKEIKWYNLLINK